MVLSHEELPIFAVVSCVRSTTSQLSVHNTSLFRTLIPSIARTVSEQERSVWDVRLYLCADDDDDLYHRSAAEVESAAPNWLRTQLIFYPRVPNRVPSREAAQHAFAEGAEYLHRTNDDILYMHPGWITSSVNALRRMRPPNVGIAGPRVYGDGSVNKMHGGVTIDVVHRTHLRIFREYYPPQLDNWFTDSWIVYAYVATYGDQIKRVAKLTRLDNFTVKHHFERRRYSPTKSQVTPTSQERRMARPGSSLPSRREARAPALPRDSNPGVTATAPPPFCAAGQAARRSS